MDDKQASEPRHDQVEPPPPQPSAERSSAQSPLDAVQQSLGDLESQVPQARRPEECVPVFSYGSGRNTNVDSDKDDHVECISVVVESVHDDQEDRATAQEQHRQHIHHHGHHYRAEHHRRPSDQQHQPRPAGLFRSTSALIERQSGNPHHHRHHHHHHHHKNHHHRARASSHDIKRSSNLSPSEDIVLSRSTDDDSKDDAIDAPIVKTHRLQQSLHPGDSGSDSSASAGVDKHGRIGVGHGRRTWWAFLFERRRHRIAAQAHPSLAAEPVQAVHASSGRHGSRSRSRQWAGYLKVVQNGDSRLPPMPGWVSSASSRDTVLMRIVQRMMAAVVIAGIFATFMPWSYLSLSHTVISSTPITTNFTGWGTSLAWWAEFVGTLSKPKRTRALSMLYDQTDQTANTSLGFNIVRYNLGGTAGINLWGWTPTEEKMRLWGGVPAFINPDGTYNWWADYPQVLVMAEAKYEYNATIFEAFANSPPWWMTISQSSRGNVHGNGENLHPSNYTIFAEYLATVMAYARDNWGITFDYLDPFNEPFSGWWQSPETMQEGCEWAPQSQTAFIPYLVRALRGVGLENATKITIADAWSFESVIRDWQGGARMDYATKINVHGYSHMNNLNSLNSYWWNSLRVLIRRRLPAHVTDLWLSETGGYDSHAVQGVSHLGMGVTQDLNLLRAKAWVYWQAIDQGKTWALVVAARDKMFGGMTSWDFNPSPTSQFYALMQFSRHIRPGDTILEHSRAGYLGTCVICVVVAYSPSKRQLSIVATNVAAIQQMHTFDASRDFEFANGDGQRRVEVYRTCEWAHEMHSAIDPPVLSSSGPGGPVVSFDLAGYSITTIVIANVIQKQ
ncbi:glycoside hydrolase superfamily [Entophlyctis helioformis]|nr:glycoside hydrolase superfamily [Entophlyctis helioformis]